MIDAWAVRLGRLRFVLGTLRLRARTALLELRGRARRRPPCAAVVPRPARLRRGRPSIELTHVLVASDLNPSYARLWPLARRAWAELAELEPILVLVAGRDDVPRELRDDKAVRIFEPVAGLHTAFQAQCIRLLYPALIETGGAVVVSDVDLVPLTDRYLARPARLIRADHFVAYRDVLLSLGEIPVCYNAGRPGTWASIFGVRDLDDVEEKLTAWARDVPYAGARGGDGWTTDQRVLYRILTERGRSSGDVWILDDHYTGFRRLERASLEKWGRISDHALASLAAGRFTDFHLLPPESSLAGLNEQAVDAAVAARRRLRP